ncbi:hypothetical protein NOF04DRAFT_13979 [Fusarium oxysporum II5]|nr:MFS transporter, SP family, general alpha glucoside:H+ symporter [Fusarium odoratissimum NRRL 54006]EXL93146.1 MFS transporter, SP family, general alpha glucoside:H+ symporter [Fusarium odoratissimum NRRL 54006]KAK2132201.1 hypothetical protein NOF04DRAFT_13979 [Fusarium oxysporum II5]
MLLSISLFTAAVFITFFSPSVEVLLVGQICQGIPWGVFQTLTTAYTAEVCPVHLRGYLTAYVNLCWVIGQFLSAGVLRAMADRTDEWAYRIPFAIQWICLLVMGGLGTRPKTSAMGWTIGSMLILYAFVYNVTVGPICYALMSEVPASKLRSKTVILVGMTYNILNIIGNVITRYMLNPGARA